MDRRERLENPTLSLIAALSGWQSDLWTAMPGIVQSFDPVAMTCVVQVAIQMEQRPVSGTGPSTWLSIKPLLDCPVYFPSGGGCTLTFPVKAGDECLVVFGSRCIDAWWQHGGVQQQAAYRMHDLSDGFALVGIRSQPRVLSAISTGAVQLRSDDGAAFVEVNPSSHAVNLTTSGTVTITAPTVTVNATTATINASGVATISAASVILKSTGAALKTLLNSVFSTWASTHVHSNGNAGANTGVPTTTPPASSQTSIVQAE